MVRILPLQYTKEILRVKNTAAEILDKLSDPPNPVVTQVIHAGEKKMFKAHPKQTLHDFLILYSRFG